MPVPVRTTNADYHFHAYDYPGSQPWTPSLAQPLRNNLCFYSMVQDLTGLVNTGIANNVPNIALNNIGVAVPANGVNRNVMALSFGGPVPAAAGTPEVVITGGIHAREWVAPEMAYLLAEYLVNNYPANNLHLTPFQTNIRNLVNSRRIHILPMLNPNGNHFTVFDPAQNARNWRRNRNPLPVTDLAWLAALTNNGNTHAPFQNAQIQNHVCEYDVPDYDPPNQIPPNLANFQNFLLPVGRIGVDLNRNYHTPAFGYNCAPAFVNAIPGRDSYFGPEVASELETQNVEQFLANLPGVDVSLDYHSYSKLILFPTEVANSAGGLTQVYLDLGEILQQLIAPSWTFPWSDHDYALGTPLALVGYDATGTLADHIALQYNSRSFVIELDPGRNDPAGFELPENQIRTVFEKNIRGALGLIAGAGQASAMQNEVRWCCFNRRTIASGERVYLNWNVYGRGNRLPT